MKIYLLANDSLRHGLIKRHVEALGHVAVDAETFQRDFADRPSAEDGVIIADLTRNGRHLDGTLKALHGRFPGAGIVLILGQGQAVTAGKALACQVRAVLREPLHLEEMELQLSLCGREASTQGLEAASG